MSQGNRYTQSARRFAGIIALIAAISLVMRVFLHMDESQSFAATLSYLTQFFTILTNSLVCLALGAVALGKHVRPRLLMSLTISIVAVGLIYHALLAHLRTLHGMDLLADHGVHTFVPALTFLWWLIYAEKEPFRPNYLASWIAWPLLYCLYAVLRAQSSGFYPYHFLDLATLGTVGFIKSITMLALAFIIMGFAMLGISKAYQKLARG